MKTGEIEEKPHNPLSLFRRFILRHSPRIWLFSVLLTAVLLIKQVAPDIRHFFATVSWRRVRP
jgi:hypothetical protein